MNTAINSAFSENVGDVTDPQQRHYNAESSGINRLCYFNLHYYLPFLFRVVFN